MVSLEMRFELHLSCAVGVDSIPPGRRRPVDRRRGAVEDDVIHLRGMAEPIEPREGDTTKGKRTRCIDENSLDGEGVCD